MGSPNALLHVHVLQLPYRWYLGRVPLGRSGERDGARWILRALALPLHDHGGSHLRVLRWPVLLAAEDDRENLEQEARTVALLDDVRLLQPDVLPDVHYRTVGPATPGLHVRQGPADPERLLLNRGVLPRRVVPDLRGQPNVVPVHRTPKGPGQSVGLAGTRMADRDADSGL